MDKGSLLFLFLVALLFVAPFFITRRIVLKRMTHNTASYKKMKKIARLLKCFVLVMGMSAVGFIFVRAGMRNDYFGAKDVRGYFGYMVAIVVISLLESLLDSKITLEEKRLQITGAIIGFCICGIILLLADAFWGITDVVLLWVASAYSVICAPPLSIYAAIVEVSKRKMEKEKTAAPCGK